MTILDEAAMTTVPEGEAPPEKTRRVWLREDTKRLERVVKWLQREHIGILMFCQHCLKEKQAEIIQHVRGAEPLPFSECGCTKRVWRDK